MQLGERGEPCDVEKREKIGRRGFSTIVSRRAPREDPGTKRTKHSLISTYVLGRGDVTGIRSS